MVLSRLAAAAVPVCLLFAQEPESPVFRANTRLVQVDVVVKGKDVPVGGLTKDDFEIFDNGKPQQVAVFSVREVDRTPAPAAPLPQGVVTNRPGYSGTDPVSATVILIDGENTYPDVLSGLQMLDGAPRRELVAVYALGTTVRVLQDFTDDRAALKAALESYIASPSPHLDDGDAGVYAGMTDNSTAAGREWNLQQQARITAAAFESIARHMKGLPGRKKLIWISSAFPITLTQQYVRNGTVTREFTNVSDYVFGPIKLLNEANIAIYPVDPRGGAMCVPPPPVATKGPPPPLPPCMADGSLTTMIRLADMTGGKTYYLQNFVKYGIEEAFADTDLTYTLGFYPTEEGLNGSQHTLSVKVKRKGVDVRYRRNYMAETATAPLTEKFLKATLSSWVNQSLEATEIRILAAATPAINKPGYYDVEVAVDASALKLEEKNGRFVGSFEMAIVPDVRIKPKGLHQVVQVNLTRERLVAALESGIVVINQVRVTNDAGKALGKKLHLVVMDQATGKAGSVRIPIGDVK